MIILYFILIALIFVFGPATLRKNTITFNSFFTLNSSEHRCALPLGPLTQVSDLCIQWLIYFYERLSSTEGFIFYIVFQ